MAALASVLDRMGIQDRVRGHHARHALWPHERSVRIAARRCQIARCVLRRVSAGVRRGTRDRRAAVRHGRRFAIRVRARGHFFQQPAARAAHCEAHVRRSCRAFRGPRAGIQLADSLDTRQRIDRVGTSWFALARGIGQDVPRCTEKPDRCIDPGGDDLRTVRSPSSLGRTYRTRPYRDTCSTDGAARSGNGIGRV